MILIYEVMQYSTVQYSTVQYSAILSWLFSYSLLSLPPLYFSALHYTTLLSSSDVLCVTMFFLFLYYSLSSLPFFYFIIQSLKSNFKSYLILSYLILFTSFRTADIWMGVLRNKAVVWIPSVGKFVSPLKVAFSSPLRDINIEPYLFLVPKGMLPFTPLLRAFGVRNRCRTWTQLKYRFFPSFASTFVLFLILFMLSQIF